MLSQSESDLLGMGREELTKCFVHALSQVDLGDNPAQPGGLAEVGLLDEECQEYSAKMSRWTKAALHDIKPADFWFTLQVAHVSRGPLDHSRRWLMKKHKEHKEAAQAKSQDDPHPAVLFFCQYCSSFLFEWHELVQGLNPIWHLLTERQGQELWAWTGTACLACLSLAADYFRRVVSPAQTWPCLLAWLAFAPASSASEQRQQMAANLVAFTDAEVGDMGTCKLRRIFGLS